MCKYIYKYTYNIYRGRRRPNLPRGICVATGTPDKQDLGQQARCSQQIVSSWAPVFTVLQRFTLHGACKCAQLLHAPPLRCPTSAATHRHTQTDFAHLLGPRAPRSSAQSSGRRSSAAGAREHGSPARARTTCLRLHRPPSSLCTLPVRLLHGHAQMTCVTCVTLRHTVSKRMTHLGCCSLLTCAHIHSRACCCMDSPASANHYALFAHSACPQQSSSPAVQQSSSGASATLAPLALSQHGVNCQHCPHCPHCPHSADTPSAASTCSEPLRAIPSENRCVAMRCCGRRAVAASWAFWKVPMPKSIPTDSLQSMPCVPRTPQSFKLPEHTSLAPLYLL